MTDIDLKDLASPVIQDFCYKIKHLDDRIKEQMHEFSEHAFKNMLVFKNFAIEKFHTDQSVQTNDLLKSEVAVEDRKIGFQNIQLKGIGDRESVKASQENEEKKSESQRAESSAVLEMLENERKEHQFQFIQQIQKQEQVQQVSQTQRVENLIGLRQNEDNSQYQKEQPLLSATYTYPVINKNNPLTEEREQVLLSEIRQLQSELEKFQKVPYPTPPPKTQGRSRGQSQQQTLGSVVNVDIDPNSQEIFLGRIHANFKQKKKEEDCNLQSEVTKSKYQELKRSSKKQSIAKVDLDLSVEASRSYSRKDQRQKDLQFTAQFLANHPLSNFTNDQINEFDKIQKQTTVKSGKLSKVKEKQQMQLFERLFNESRVKAEHIKQLKFKLQVLERSHWEDVLTIFNKQKQEVQEKVDPEQSSFIVSQQSNSKNQELPFSRRTTQEYYQKVKEKNDQVRVDNHDNIYLNWFGRQRIQMDRMIEQFNLLQKSKQPMLLPTQKVRNKTFSPQRDINLISQATKTRAVTQKLTDPQNTTNAFTFYEGPISLLPTNISELLKESRKGKKFKLK